ncbi:unnamed protein product [Mycena citricolor]|uniref:Cytochrome P450 n=2 Tax=Mycena citricolor TaxID=2018698 RepID=A0AAD2GZE0_9AGAR|nr:unnamed protein product [Mycena citricolor]
MSHSTLIPIWAASALMGVVNHFHFRRYEPTNAHRPALAILLQPPLALFLLSLKTSAALTWTALGCMYAGFICALLSSITLYRVSPWHPLSAVPGPVGYKISKLWILRDVARGDMHRVVRRMHEKYGPVVRTGPNEVSIAHVDAVKPVLGALPKGQYYEARYDPSIGTRSLLILRDDAHTSRRRIWNRAMNSDAVEEYTATMRRRVSALLQKLEAQSLTSASTDLSSWLGYFTFDFMGDMAFGGGFEMLQDGGDKNGLWEVIENGAWSLAFLSHIPWLSHSVMLLPGVQGGLMKLRRFGVASATNRVNAGSRVKDLWYHLTDEAELEKERPSFREVVADGVLSIIAGSDTTSTALSGLFWLLLSHPDAYKRVQAEVDGVYPRGDSPMDPSKHNQLPYLTACLNEALRLLPPVPSGSPRKVPGDGGGRVIAAQYIPPDTQVYVPTYTLHRSAKNFHDPDTFRPERWLPGAPGANQIHNPLGFIPFSFGFANCVGKNLAMREMVMVGAALAQTFDMRFADGFAAEEWTEHLHDVFVTSIGMPLLVKLTKRTT